MANHKSALKRIRQNEKIRDRNSKARSACRTAVKKTRAAIASGDKDAATAAFRVAQKALATAATKRLYHKNNVQRRIGRLAKQVAALS